MKNILTTLLIPILVLCGLLGSPLSFASERPDQVIAKSYDCRGFKGLDISYAYDVALSKGSYKVELEVPSFLEPYVIVNVHNGVLYIGMESLPKSVQRLLRKGDTWVKAYVRMPSISNLTLSGATSLKGLDDFKTSGTFRMELGGASKIKDLRITGEELDLRMSGASEMPSFVGVFDFAHIRSSGSSKASLSLDSLEADMNLSGSSDISLVTELDYLGIDASGAAKARLSGKYKKVKFNGSGAVYLYAEDAPTRDYAIKLSGASNARIQVTKSMKVELSGASTCRYKAPENVKVLSEHISKGSELRKLQ